MSSAILRLGSRFSEKSHPSLPLALLVASKIASLRSDRGLVRDAPLAPTRLDAALLEAALRALLEHSKPSLASLMALDIGLSRQTSIAGPERRPW